MPGPNAGPLHDPLIRRLDPPGRQLLGEIRVGNAARRQIAARARDAGVTAHDLLMDGFGCPVLRFHAVQQRAGMGDPDLDPLEQLVPGRIIRAAQRLPECERIS